MLKSWFDVVKSIYNIFRSQISIDNHGKLIHKLDSIQKTIYNEEEAVFENQSFIIKNNFFIIII